MDKHWCMCKIVTGVARDGFSTCMKCGGKDAYKSSSERVIVPTKSTNPTYPVIEINESNMPKPWSPCSGVGCTHSSHSGNDG